MLVAEVVLHQSALECYYTSVVGNIQALNL